MQILSEYEELYAEALAMRGLPKWEQWNNELNRQTPMKKAPLLAGGTLSGMMLTTPIGRQVYNSVDYMKGIDLFQAYSLLLHASRVSPWLTQRVAVSG